MDISLHDLVGQGYGAFWHFQGRYRVVKGSRASKKSKTAALWFIVKLMQHPCANLLVVRKTYRTLKDSCFTELRWAIARLGVQNHWKITESPLEITYLPTGQKIFFRGLDDPLKVTSMTVEVGVLCWLWIEEAYEILDETAFDTLNESIRGEVPSGLFKQITLTFNPWNEHHWLKRRFFDAPSDPNILAITTNYTINEWLDDADRKLFEDMKQQNPRRYRVAGLGEWGIVEGVIYENWKEEAFNIGDIQQISGIRAAFGLDFGYTNDPSALWCGFVDLIGKRIFVFDELYQRGMSNEALFRAISDMGYRKERIWADAAEPKSIDRLRELGLVRLNAARKGRDSVIHGIDFIRDFEIIVHPKCVHFLKEIANYTWQEDGFGKRLNVPVNDFNHLMDAMRYGLEEFSRGRAFSFE